ncbi:MAG TPA: efflux RND transporter periplasmic adaptor subunit [Thermoanaerobaculia bacterium]|jgi:multidrug resistance efflux pump|nr:efflux RND transporter periplasmic adaptor subunit [Thermoanaerobaculia bacterium]
MKKAVWVGVAIAIAVAGTWGYGALARREDDSGRPVRLLAIAEEQSLALSFSRSGRLISPVPEEGETVRKGDTVARIEEPGLSEDASDYQRQMAQARAREKGRQEEVARLQAQLAEATSEEKRVGRLVKEGIAPAAQLETVQHRREGIAAEIRAREAEKGRIVAEGEALEVRLGKVRRFEKEGALIAHASGSVLTRHHRQGEWVTAGDPIVTVELSAPYLRVEVPEERLSAFSLGKSVEVWPQARPDAKTRARIISIRPRSEFATRRNWGLQSRDLRTFSVRLAPEGPAVISGQTFVVEAGSN